MSLRPLQAVALGHKAKRQVLLDPSLPVPDLTAVGELVPSPLGSWV